MDVPAEEKVVETWSALGGGRGVRKPLRLEGDVGESCGGGRGNGVSQAEGVAEANLGS